MKKNQGEKRVGACFWKFDEQEPLDPLDQKSESEGFNRRRMVTGPKQRNDPAERKRSMKKKKKKGGKRENKVTCRAI